MSHPMPDELDPAAQRVIAKVRRLMAISVLFTGVAVAAVLAVIGYRVFRSEGSAPVPVEASATLPAGAKVVGTAVNGDRLVVTVEIAGRTELHLFDLRTLAPRGRLQLRAAP
jgi:Family of unknown function (DUF6476)